MGTVYSSSAQASQATPVIPKSITWCRHSSPAVLDFSATPPVLLLLSPYFFLPPSLSPSLLERAAGLLLVRVHKPQAAGGRRQAARFERLVEASKAFGGTVYVDHPANNAAQCRGGGAICRLFLFPHHSPLLSSSGSTAGGLE